MNVIRISKQHPLLSFIIIHAIVILGLYSILNYQVYIDPEGLERQFATNIIDSHLIPYRDFSSEYPPLAILSFLLPGLIFRGPFSYCVAFAAEIYVADVIILILLSKLLRRMNFQIFQVLGVYTLFILAVGPISPVRHDMIPAALVIGALYAFSIGKIRTTFALLSLGIMAKIYPIILVPLIAFQMLRNKQYSELFNGINTLLVIAGVIAIPWLIIDSHSFFYFIRYQAERGLQSESSYASVLLIGQILGLTSVKGSFSFGSWNLSSPLADNLSEISSFITAGLLIVSYIIFGFNLGYQKNPKVKIQSSRENQMDFLIRYSLIVILILILTNKVFSPQYLIWVCPLLLLLKIRQRYLVWSIFIVIAVLTQWIFPYHYLEYELAEAGPVLIEAARNVMVVLLIWAVSSSNQKIAVIRERKSYYLSESDGC